MPNRTSLRFFTIIRFAFMVFYCILKLEVHAQYFEKVYGDNDNTSGVMFAKTGDGGIVIAGSRFDSVSVSGYYLLKLDSNGNRVWEKSITNVFHAFAYAITTLKDGKIVLLGTHTGALFPIVAELMVFDTDGNLLKTAVYPPFDGWGTAGVALNSSGDSTVTITLYNDGFISNNYYTIYSLHTDLSIKWSDFTSFDGSFITAHGLASKADSYIYSMSYYDNYFFTPIPKFRVTSIRKHNNSGSLLLDSIYEFNCITAAITPVNDGGAVICGMQDSSAQRDIVIIRIDSSGNLLWQRQFGTPYDEETHAVIQTSDNGFVVLSTIEDSVIRNQHDLLIVKTNSNGDSLWSRQFGGTLNESGLHIEEQNNDLVIMGTTNSFNEDHIYLLHADSLGSLQSPYNIFSNGRYFCQGDTAILQLVPVPAGLIITWSNGDTGNPAIITQTGNYFATITDSNGLFIQTPFYPVYISNLAHSDIGPDTLNLCSGIELINLSNQELTNTYQWFLNDTLLVGENGPSFLPQQAGMYKLIVSNYCGTDSSVTFIDTVYKLPVRPVITSASTNMVCPGDSLLLTIIPETGVNYQWYTTNFNQIFLIPGATDTLFYAHESNVYVVKAADSNGCSVFSFTYQVTYDFERVFVAPGGPSYFCEGGEVVLTVPPGSGYSWSNGDTTRTITVNSSGGYYVTFTNSHGCVKTSDTLQINVFSKPLIDIGNDTALCEVDTILLDAGAGYNNYLWNNGSTDQSRYIFSAGPYPDSLVAIVSVIDSNGCTAADTLSIIFDLCIGINENQGSIFSLYPNPVASGNELYFSGTFNSLIIQLTDLWGRSVLKQTVPPDDFRVDIKNITPGIYLFTVFEFNKVIKTGKLVVF